MDLEICLHFFDLNLLLSVYEFSLGGAFCRSFLLTLKSCLHISLGGVLTFVVEKGCVLYFCHFPLVV